MFVASLKQYYCERMSEVGTVKGADERVASGMNVSVYCEETVNYSVVCF